MEFDEINGSQEEDENLDDVIGTQLVNETKNMDIGDIRPREVIDVKITRIKCSLTQMTKLVVLKIKVKQVLVLTKCKINYKWLVHHLNQMTNQVQAIKFKCSNQPVLQEIIVMTQKSLQLFTSTSSI